MKIKFLGITWRFGIVLGMFHGILFMGACAVLMIWPVMMATAKDHEIKGIVALGIVSFIYFMLSMASMEGIQEYVLKSEKEDKKEK